MAVGSVMLLTHENPSRKNAYLHAFVALAGASASIAGRPRGSELMQAAINIIDERFWLEDEQSMLPSFAADWSELQHAYDRSLLSTGRCHG